MTSKSNNSKTNLSNTIFPPKSETSKSHPDFSFSSISSAIEDTTPISHVISYLQELLENLHGIQQSPRFHPEGDTLYHSLQVFECALSKSKDPKLWAAALFHDVGKAIDYENHDIVGAAALDGIFTEEICWLIEHHLDLLKKPKLTRAKYLGQKRLQELEKLRKWDLAGRKTDVLVMDIEEALELLRPHFKIIVNPDNF